MSYQALWACSRLSESFMRHIYSFICCPHGLPFTWWGCYGLCLTYPIHSFVCCRSWCRSLQPASILKSISLQEILNSLNTWSDESLYSSSCGGCHERKGKCYWLTGEKDGRREEGRRRESPITKDCFQTTDSAETHCLWSLPATGWSRRSICLRTSRGRTGWRWCSWRSRPPAHPLTAAPTDRPHTGRCRPFFCSKEENVLEPAEG